MATAVNLSKISLELKKTDAKLKAGVFVGPEIRKLMQNEEFGARLNPLELDA